MTIHFNWAAETSDLIPQNHMEKKRTISFEHAIHALVETIHFV